MSIASHSTRTATFGSKAVAMVRAMATAIVQNWRAWKNSRQVAVLLEFDDHMLRDIGLTRGDVTSALSSPASVDPSARLRILAVERRASTRAQARERLANAAELRRESGERPIAAE